jgi:hypothetical protein|tara:strand:- start:317 stop:604 length:288 start_codon:yes stop_codon:yes gene_type:complete
MIKMEFTSLNLIKDLLETNLFGNTWLLGLFVLFFFIIILLICRVFPEAAFLLPLPLIIAMAEAGIIPFFFKPLIYILSGIYLGIVILLLVGLYRR